MWGKRIGYAALAGLLLLANCICCSPLALLAAAVRILHARQCQSVEFSDVFDAGLTSVRATQTDCARGVWQWVCSSNMSWNKMLIKMNSFTQHATSQYLYIQQIRFRNALRCWFKSVGTDDVRTHVANSSFTRTCMHVSHYVRWMGHSKIFPAMICDSLCCIFLKPEQIKVYVCKMLVIVCLINR